MNRLIALAVLLVLVASPLAQATVVEALDLQQLCEKCDSSFRGTCVASHPEWTSDHAYVVTVYEFRVTEWLKGGDGSGTTFVTHLGGEKDGVGTGVVGMPRYEDGEEMVLFINRAHEKTGCCLPLGFGQGAYHVKQSARGGLSVFRSFAGIVFWNPATGTTTEPSSEMKGEQPLDDFLTEVRAKIASNR